MSFYDLKMKKRDNSLVSLNEYRNKVLLIVNTAINDEFTKQYEQLEYLYEKYNQKGLEILDFPTDQFGYESSLNESEIYAYCRNRYNIKFLQLAKIKVNGPNETKLYTYLKRAIPTEDIKGLRNKFKIKNLKKYSNSYEKEGDIVWNFTKFIINKEGTVIKRYDPTYPPRKMEDEIINLLKQ